MAPAVNYLCLLQQNHWCPSVYFPSDRQAGARPEVIIALPAASVNPAEDVVRFKAGQQVRILRAPYRGKIGGLAGILPDMVTLPNGLGVQVAEVRLEGNEKVVVPLANLEVLG